MSGGEILIGIGAVLSAGSQIIQGKKESKARKRQAENERIAAAEEESDFRRQQRRLLATRRAGTAASNISLQGTPLLVDTAILDEIEFSAERIRRGGERRSSALTREARNVRTNSLFGAGTTLLTDGAELFE